jgi:uncharacterized membrane protein HdeD (DUF308 family)
MFVARGVLACIFGLLALAFPGAALATIVLFFGAFFFADGVVAIVHGLAWRKQTHSWWVYCAEGVLAVAAGLVTFSWPGVTALALIVVIATWAILAGAMKLMAAFRLRKIVRGEWLLALSGIVSILFGALTLARPGAGALALLWLVAVYALALGALEVALGIHLRLASDTPPPYEQMSPAA